MEWVPTVFIAFKLIVLGIGMFFAIKWHYDQARKKDGAAKQREVLRTSAIVAVVFLLLVAGLVVVTLSFGQMLGLDLS
ncbi:hypothetical protein OU995_13550 [Roseateles sp. SL47]|jgi:cytochrome c biogenesis factor|uniref:hypothetical protein n=1 Tax=Roseateles sp. SL47 TaxID=2995138 RepID=UPI0022721463|nr:hypothetical protein [Roseateles sp. SL47]WAC75654.1 hypothetical protein OU995_13550 [Roseateles sp. SL47]